MVIKRDGRKVEFDKQKIYDAVFKAAKEVEPTDNDLANTISSVLASIIAINITNTKLPNKDISVEEIQDAVEKELMSVDKEVAQAYIRYRYKRELARETNLLKTFMDIANCKNDYWKSENSNKNYRLNTTVRDNIAGAASTEATRTLLLPKDIVKAHDEGIIHFHDTDYEIQSMYNCSLVNLEDMLQNGTAINEQKIDKPHSFTTACTIATQIVNVVASNQYGGQSISLAHLAPFVDISRQAIRKQVKDIINTLNCVDEDICNGIAEKLLAHEIEQGIQTIQYQILTFMTTNGQSPFVTLFMYLNEAKNEQEKHDLALLIEEVLKQTIKGVKNEEGVYVTPPFPKIIYVLQEDNITEDSKYWYLTELAAKCSLKRLAPDYISEKVMKRLKQGNCFPVMGCVDGDSYIKYQLIMDNVTIENCETFVEAWETLTKFFTPKQQIKGNNDYLYLDVEGVKIWDGDIGYYVNVSRVIRNKSSEWIHLETKRGYSLTCTTDHPLPVYANDELFLRMRADELKVGDELATTSDINKLIETNCYYDKDEIINIERISNKEDYSYDVTTESDHFEVSGIYSHNCRSALSPYYDENGEPKFYGRFNKGVVTLNLVDLALSSNKDMDKFWELFEERTELCHKALLCRYKKLKGVKTDVAPTLWEHGAIARLPKGSTIDNLLVGGYSSISLGYAGLYECVKYMTGHSHADEDIGEKFGLQIMQKLNDKCDEWNKQLNLGFGIYGTPIESTTYKFAKLAKKKFGDDVFIKLDGHDRDYITNSYHIPVFEQIDAFEKLRIEAKFQELSKGGSISYIECPNLDNNVEAAIEVIKYIYDHNMYAELNTKSDYCQKCGYDKEIELIDENNQLIWKCPNCGNTDVRTMDITRRTCGYKGTARNGWNQGRLDEIKHRVIHLDDIEHE